MVFAAAMRIAGCAVLASCAAPSTDVVGPFTGPAHRFVVDTITIPRDTATSDALAGDHDCASGVCDNGVASVGVCITTAS
ncbi:MAG: hypothetical protein H0T42_22225 [Deltaproteobacteria bacterium]|nr:hypothetical protein [Deltaproteobacteria bacterium]